MTNYRGSNPEAKSNIHVHRESLKYQISLLLGRVAERCANGKTRFCMSKQRIYANQSPIKYCTYEIIIKMSNILFRSFQMNF